MNFLTIGAFFLGEAIGIFAIGIITAGKISDLERTKRRLQTKIIELKEGKK